MVLNIFFNARSRAVLYMTFPLAPKIGAVKTPSNDDAMSRDRIYKAAFILFYFIYKVPYSLTYFNFAHIYN